MDRITRSKLKTDRFAVEVEHSVEYVAEHRKQVILYGSIALAVVAIIAGIYYYLDRKHDQRQLELAQAMDIMQAIIGNSPPGGGLAFPTDAARNTAAEKAFKDLLDKYSGSQEGTIASLYLGALATDQNKLADAEKYFQKAVDTGDRNYASMAKLSLAQVYFSTNRPAEGEKLLRSLYDNPTLFVSKEQAAIALARALAVSKPAEARKLLDPLKSERPAVGQAAITLLAQLPAQ